MLVDHAAVLIQQLHGNAALRRRGRNSEAGLHVLDNLARAAANRDHFTASLFGDNGGNWFALRRGSSAGFGRRRRGLRLHRFLCDDRRSAAAVLGSVGLRSYRCFAQQLSEVSAPRLVNQIRVAAKTTQQTFNITRIRAEVLGNYF